MTRRALLLINRNARQGRDALREVVPLLRRQGFDVAEESAGHPRGLSDLVRSYRGRADLVIVGGGDGTLNAVADGVVDAQLPLGILPLGTANDLARTLGLPTDLPSACQVIADGNQRRIDLGCVNGKHYFNVASVGMTVKITQDLSKEAKGRWGVFAYLFSAGRILMGMRPFHAEIHAGGEVMKVKSVQIAVGNGRHYGGGMTVAEDAAIDDGLLNLYSLEVDHWWQVIPMLPSIRRGDLAKLARVRTLRGREFEIHTRRPRRVNTDGELTTTTPARFRLVPQAISVFAPPAAVPEESAKQPEHAAASA